MISKAPYVSVIVPCYNEKERIRDCLLALIRQECDLPYEIVVVDDGSNDGAANQVKSFTREAASKNINVRLISAEHGGPARARNIGIKNAIGELILFIDADCVASPAWIKTLARRAKGGGVAGVGGTYRTQNPESKVAGFIGLDIEYRHSKMGSYTDFAGSYNVCFKKKVLVEVEGFDESFKEANAEDNDLCYRILEKGYKLAYEPDAWVMHPHPSTLRQFTKQQFKRAMWRVFLYGKKMKWIRGDKYAGLSTLIQPVILAVSFLTLIFGSIFAPLSMIPIAALMLGVTCLTGLNLRFLRWIRQRGGSVAFILFGLLMIFLRNASWCLGACYGLIRFFPKQG
jgi:cellulose synthase/poly-beta-1,6-N-acetylglucosamine synthase-like glycosyltransferase